MVPNHQETTDHTTRQVEKLDALYKTIGQAFREANDQGGVNEAWYLQTVAKREQDPSFWRGFSWLFLDIPSRYTVDVWRTVWVSVLIMLCFYVLYVLEFLLFKVGTCFRHVYQRVSLKRTDAKRDPWAWARREELRTVRTLGHDQRHRAFRLRLFESLHSTKKTSARPYVFWRDAATLSMRAFLKIGLGTVYPNTRLLKVFTTVEWLLGAYMLIHFILSVKNNLPFIAPFLGVVN